LMFAWAYSFICPRTGLPRMQVLLFGKSTLPFHPDTLDHFSTDHLEGRMAFKRIIFHKSTTDGRTWRRRRAAFWRKVCHDQDESGDEQAKCETNRPLGKEGQDNDG
jgi:hypothetical protein